MRKEEFQSAHFAIEGGCPRRYCHHGPSLLSPVPAQDTSRSPIYSHNFPKRRKPALGRQAFLPSAALQCHSCTPDGGSCADCCRVQEHSSPQREDRHARNGCIARLQAVPPRHVCGIERFSNDDGFTAHHRSSCPRMTSQLGAATSQDRVSEMI